MRRLLPILSVMSVCLVAAPAAQAQKPNPLKVPDLFRDCGSKATSRPNQPSDPRGVNPAAPNPLAGDSFFVDPTEQSVKDYARYLRAGRKADAASIAKLAFRPKARWLGAFTRPNMPLRVRNYLNCVQVFQPGATPLFTVLRHQGKRCNARYQAGGVAEDNATKAWYRALAGAIGDNRVVIAFEPDSIGTIECLARSRRQARKDLLRYGVDVLSKLPNATIYLEGTASDWKSARFTASHAALPGHQQGARVHAQRDPLRLDVEEHRLRAQGVAAGGGQAVRGVHLLQRPRPGVPEARQASRERLLQPALPRPGPGAHHHDRLRQGRRVPVPEPARAVRCRVPATAACSRWAGGGARGR